MNYAPHDPDFWEQVDIKQVQRREQELGDEEYYELQDMRRQYPPIPLCDTLINEDTL